MIKRPELSDEIIISCLRFAYGISIMNVKFLAVGNDATAWAFRVEAMEGIPYFLKVRIGDVYIPSLTVPHYLQANGVPQAVAPLKTRDLKLWSGMDPFYFVLYPFIEGTTGFELGMSDNQWLLFGKTLRDIHSIILPQEIAKDVNIENFKPKWADVVRKLDQIIRTKTFIDPISQKFAGFWKNKQNEIGKILKRTEKLGKSLQNQSLDIVLCHSDIHTFNIMFDQNGNLYVMDWDNPLFAPKERDLMFINEAENGQAEWFYKGYGKVNVDPLAIAYYRYEWVVQEMGDYGARVFLMEDAGNETRLDAVNGFIVLFQPGDVIEMAYRSEINLR